MVEVSFAIKIIEERRTAARMELRLKRSYVQSENRINTLPLSGSVFNGATAVQLWGKGKMANKSEDK